MKLIDYIFFGSFREPLLIFLRNLTPQVILWTAAVVSSAKLDLHKFDPSNFWNSLPFIIICLTLLVAMVANISIFIEGACTSIQELEESAKELIEQNGRGFSYLWSLIALTFKCHKVLFIQVCLVFIVVMVGFVVVMISAVPAISTIYNTLQLGGVS